MFYALPFTIDYDIRYFIDLDSTPNLPKAQETIHKYNDNFKQYSFDVETVKDVLIDVQTVVNKFQSFYGFNNSTLQTNKCNRSLSVCVFQ